MKHVEVNIQTSETDQNEVLIAQLMQQGYIGIQEEEDSIKAYIEEDNYSKEQLEKTLSIDQKSYHTEILEEKNWNEYWESNYPPVIIEDYLAIRAPFHKHFQTKYEITIEPKMAFGTGHHESTESMVKLMSSVDFKEKTVLDFGSGTAVLAILAAKLEAKHVDAVDNNPWAFNSSKENALVNNTDTVHAYLADEHFLEDKNYDVILANLNRTALIDHATTINQALTPNATLIFSGVLKQDKDLVIAPYEQLNMKLTTLIEKGDWIGGILMHK